MRSLLTVWLLLAGTLSASAQVRDHAKEISGTDFVSHATGFYAVYDIVKSTQRQQELEISSEQQAALSRLLQDRETQETIQKTLRARGLYPLSVAGARIRDRIIAEKLSAILTPAQIRAMRISYLRKDFKSPVNVFFVSYLTLMEVDDDDAQRLCSELSGPNKERLAEYDKFMSSAIDEILLILRTDDLRGKFVHCFGPDLLPDAKLVHDDGVSTAIFQEAKGMDLLLYAPLIMPDKWTQLNEHARVLYAKKQASPNLNIDRLADSDLKSMLTKEQLAALIRRKQLAMLRDDFTTLGRQEFIAYLDLASDDADALRQASQKVQKDLRALRIKTDLDFFHATLDRLPVERKKAIVELFDGVWPTE